MPCVAQRRKSDVLWSRRDFAVASTDGIHRVANPRRSTSPAPLDARRETATFTPAVRRHCRPSGTLPIPVVTANGRPQARNEEG